MQTIQIRRGNSNVADSRGAGKKTSAGKQAGQGSSIGRSGQNSSRRAQGSRPQRTRDREAEATIREMREGDVNRRQTVSRQKQRRLKQMRSRLTVLSACIVIAVTCGAFFGAVDAGWLEGGETAKRLVRERGIFAGWSAGNAGTGKNGETGDDGGEETNSENAAESASNQAETAAAFAEKAGKMKGVLATVKIKADNPEDVDGDGRRSRSMKTAIIRRDIRTTDTACARTWSDLLSSAPALICRCS